MRDLSSRLGVVTALSPAVQATTVNGVAVDLMGFNGAMFVLQTGAIVGSGDFTAKLQESDVSGSGYTDVAVADLIGSFPAATLADAAVKVGYIGNKRFTRIVLTKNSGTSIAAGATAIRGHAESRPVA